LSYKNDGH